MRSRGTRSRPGIDAGEILWQEPVTIAADDTALTLNARCFEAAMSSFRTLSGQLANGTATRRAQTPGQRTYFGRNKRPPAAGLLDWREPRATLAAFVRGLDFGGYRNPLLCPKVLVGSEFISPRKAVLDASSLSGAPGTILGIEGETMVVQTGDGALALSGFTDLEGRARPLAALVAAHGLHVGSVLPQASADLRARLTEVAKASAPHEAAWLARLARLEPTPAPYAEAPEAGRARGTFAHLDAELPTFGGTDRPAADVAVAAVVAFVARCTGRARVDVAFGEPALAAAVAGVEAAFAARVPLSVELDGAQPFSVACAAVHGELARVRRAGAYPRDLVARYPELEAVRGAVLPVCVELVADLAAAPPPQGQFVVQIAADGRRARLALDAATFSQAQVSQAQGSQAQGSQAQGSEGQGARLQRQFEVFVAALAAAPARALSAQPLMGSDERQRVLHDWNATARAVAPECIHTQFRRQAARTPQAVAVRSRGRTLTYAELDDRSDRLAARLQGLGVVADSRVGVYLGRSVDTAVALLGILKAGGAYVPLDPDYPGRPHRVHGAGLRACAPRSSTRAHARTFPACQTCRGWSSTTEATETLTRGRRRRQSASRRVTSPT
jgi:hypothetical protein